MLYSLYEIQQAWRSSATAMASVTVEWLNNPKNPMGSVGCGPSLSSALEVFAHAAEPRGKPAFGR